MTPDLNDLHPIDRIRLLAHGSLGLDEPADAANFVSFATFSKAKRTREQARWRRRVERIIGRDFDDAG
jgi:hypothetical protein